MRIYNVKDAYEQLEALADDAPETSSRLDELMRAAADNGEHCVIWEPPAEERAN